MVELKAHGTQPVSQPALPATVRLAKAAAALSSLSEENKLLQQNCIPSWLASSIQTLNILTPCADEKLILRARLWLEANPHELRKCLSVTAALATVANACRIVMGSEDVAAATIAAYTPVLNTDSYALSTEVDMCPVLGPELLCRNNGIGFRLMEGCVGSMLSKHLRSVRFHLVKAKLSEATPSLTMHLSLACSADEPTVRAEVEAALSHIAITQSHVDLHMRLAGFVIGRRGRNMDLLHQTVTRDLEAAANSKGCPSGRRPLVRCIVATGKLIAACLAPTVKPHKRIKILHANLQSALRRALKAEAAALRRALKAEAGACASRKRSVLKPRDPSNDWKRPCEFDGSVSKERRARKLWIDAHMRTRRSKSNYWREKLCETFAKPLGGERQRGYDRNSRKGKNSRHALVQFASFEAKCLATLMAIPIGADTP